MSESLSLATFMGSNSVFSQISDMEKTRLIPFIELETYEAGETIFKKGDAAETVYFIAEGDVSLQEGENTLKAQEVIGSESAFQASHYKYSAITETVVKVFKIPSSVIQKLIEDHPHVASCLFLSFSGLEEKPKASEKQQDTELSQARVLLAWIMAFAAPIATFHLLSPGITYSSRMFLAALSCGVVLWMFNVVYEFVPGLIVVISTLVLGLVSSKAILGGFSSDTALLFICLSGLASVIVSSGLLLRLVTYILKYLPQKQGWYSSGLFLLGSIITPVIPSIVNRAQMVAPVTQDLIELLKIKKKSTLATKISVASFYGVSAISSIFLTGSMMNFISMGLLPLQEQYQIASIGWTTAALVPAIVFIVINLFAIPLWFHSRDRIVVPQVSVNEQIKTLGPLSESEWQAFVAVLFFVASILSVSYHNIQIAWLSLFLFFGLSALKIIKLKEWGRMTDWSFFIFTSTVIGISNGINELGIDTLIKQSIVPYFTTYASGTTSVLTSLVVITLLMRFILPIGPTFVIMMSFAMPIGAVYGISLWVIAFTILVVCDIWFFAYQCPFYLRFRDGFEGEVPYNQHHFLSYNMVANMARIIGLYLALPYWHYLGLM